MGIVMNIELTRDQYQALLKSLAITRFLYHSILDEEEPAADRLDSYDTFEDMEQQILSYAKAVEASHLVAYDKEEELHYLTREFEEKRIFPISLQNIKIVSFGMNSFKDSPQETFYESTTNPKLKEWRLRKESKKKPLSFQSMRKFLQNLELKT